MSPANREFSDQEKFELLAQFVERLISPEHFGLAIKDEIRKEAFYVLTQVGKRS